MKEAAAKALPKPSVVSLAQLLAEQPAAPPPGWIEPGLLPPEGILFVGDPPKTVVKLVQVPCQGRPYPQNRVGVHALSPSRNRVPERCHRLAA